MSPRVDDLYSGATELQSRVRPAVRVVANRLWRFDLRGFEQLPETGPAILCANHVSFLDSAFLIIHAPRNISFVGKSEYLDSWKTRRLFPALGMIPIDREGGEKAQVALDAAENVLQRGELFGIFPESPSEPPTCAADFHCASRNSLRAMRPSSHSHSVR